MPMSASTLQFPKQRSSPHTTTRSAQATPDTMQPSQSEIQREFEALRDIRRRSSSQGGPGALLLDPDLPAQPVSPVSPLSPQAKYWPPGTSEPSVASSAVDGAKAQDGSGSPADDPFHLFWVPAHLHPELAPSEFRDFLKEHARGPATDGSAASLSRASSGSSSLGRKTSMLSRQYRPRENDGVEDEDRVVPLQRSRSRIYDNSGPQLTISDLQKLEKLAEEASQSDDPTKLRSVLRRSLSLNVSPSVIDQMDDMPDLGDDADSPIIVPKPNQILRRAARTKIRKPGLVGDGGGHRFGPTRRRGATTETISSDVSSSDHGDAEGHKQPLSAHEDDESEESMAHRRNTYTEESLIYDAYARDEADEKEMPLISTSPTPLVVELPPVSPPPVPRRSEEPPLEPVLHHPQPQRHLAPPIHQPSQTPSRTPSPDTAHSHSSSPDEHRKHDAPTPDHLAFLNTSPSPTDKRKEKDKKGILRKWGGDKNSKKSGKDKDREKEPKDREKEKEKDSGFFGSLFGGSKKKQEEHSQQTLGHTGAGPATAAALLGASKSSKTLQGPASPQLAGAYARYPIHVERAVYRLSHIKLANPRRPLYEQVLISNLMFWYLGVINKSQQTPGQSTTQTPQASQPGAPNTQGESSETTSPVQNAASEKDGVEAEGRERDEVERGEREREKMERETERERIEQKRETRRGSLTKTPAAGSSAAAGRRAEMPVRGPQYGLQHQAIEQEYGPNMGAGPPSMGRTASSPHSPSGYPHRSQPQPPKQQMGNIPPMMYQPQPQNANLAHPRPTSPELLGKRRSASPGRNVQPNLPPGAMPPLPYEQSWITSSLSSSGQRSPPSSSTPPSPSRTSPPHSADSALYRPARSSRSPPPLHYPKNEGSISPSGGKLQGRSLSANAIATNNALSMQQNGALKKRMPSANAVNTVRRPRTSEGGVGEEEDVPLAVWQQQRRK